jgi:hypothetical protein
MPVSGTRILEIEIRDLKEIKWVCIGFIELRTGTTETFVNTVMKLQVPQKVGSFSICSMEFVTSTKRCTGTDSETIHRIIPTWTKCYHISHVRLSLSVPVSTPCCTSEVLLTVFTKHLLSPHIKHVKMFTLVCAAHFMTIIYCALASFRSSAVADDACIRKPF